MTGYPGFDTGTPGGTIWASIGSTDKSSGSRGKDCVGLMSWFSSNNNKSDRQNERPARPEFPLESWRDEKVEDPFDDPKVRKRIAELIIRSVVKPGPFGA